MTQTGPVQLKRDCEATQIPAGTAVVLPAGTPVAIIQTLGGAYTVEANGGLFRLAASDADCLGLAPAEPAPSADPEADHQPANEQGVWDACAPATDPEIPVNIVDLGLVYDLHVETLPSGSARVAVQMTLTAPGCGMGPAIAADAQQKLSICRGVEEASVQIVWDPPLDAISNLARRTFQTRA